MAEVGDDEDFLLLIRSGDREAIGMFFESNVASLYEVLLSRWKDEENVKDAVQAAVIVNENLDHRANRVVYHPCFGYGAAVAATCFS